MKSTKTRNQEIVSLRNNGFSWSDIADRYLLSIGRVRQIVEREAYKTERAQQAGELAVLSVRARNVLENNGIHSKEEAKLAIESGKLSSHWKARIRNYGILTEQEVIAWSGADVKTKRRCPCCNQLIKSVIPTTSQ